MRWIALLIIFVSCSSNQLSRREEVENRWSILERSIDNGWKKSKILNMLGEPSRKHLKNEESWIYNSKQTGFQEWVIHFDLKSKKVIGVTFGPTGILDKEFTQDKILKRWGKLNCKKRKSDMYMKGHTVYQDTFYLCDGNKRVDLNRYGEVTWISVSRNMSN